VAAAFTELRPLLFAIAYEILGSASDAEDVLQESYLRWRRVRPETVRHPRQYLAQTVTRQALNHLRAAGRRRETYVGSWLPEPIETEPALAEDPVLADAVSLAMLVLLESLGPDERAVFVLHEVFGYRLTEVARLVGKSEAAVRQAAHRAGERVRTRRHRFEPDPAEAEAIVARFLRAARTGDLQRLMDVLSPDVVQISDGGGKVRGARCPVHGRERVARFSIGVVRRAPRGERVDLTRCNGMPTVVSWSGEVPVQAVLFDVDDGQVHGIYAVRNPDKLAGLGVCRPLAR
jgi:RNA polymerase sigma-70 factor (ECF subfamily)